jgi:hypothetical protein
VPGGGDDGYEYVVGLKDELSKPAARMRDELGRFTSALKESDSGLKKHASEAKHAASAHREAAHAIKEHESVLKSFLSSLARSAVGGGIGGGLVGAVAQGTLIAHGVEKVGELVGEGVRFAIEASEFKENAIAAYTVVRGTAEEGERTFNELDKAAREIHMPAERAHQIAQQLMIEGLESQKAVTDTVRAVGDLQRVGLEAGAGKIQALVERSIAAGHFELKGARALKGTGVTFDALAGELGMGRKQFESEMRQGKISVETGIEAIDQVILKGKVGALATKKFTVSDALVDMKNAIRGVLQETDSGPVVDAFKRMSEAFVEGGESAKDTKEAINALIELGGGLIDLSTGIGHTLVAAINALKGALLGAKAAAGGLLDALGGVVKSAAGLFQSAEDKRFSKQAETDVDKRIDKEIRTRIERAKMDAIEDFKKSPHTTAEIHAFGKKINVDLYNAGTEEPGGAASREEKALRAQLMKPLGPVSFAAPPPAESFAWSERGKEPIAPAAHKPNLDPGLKLDMANLGKQSAESLQSGYRDANKQHSPSAAMYDLGEESALSLQSGAAAAAAFADRAPAKEREPAAAGKQIHVDVSVGGIHMQGMAHMEDFVPFLESQVADVFDRVALELGQ